MSLVFHFLWVSWMVWVKERRQKLDLQALSPYLFHTECIWCFFLLSRLSVLAFSRDIEPVFPCPSSGSGTITGVHHCLTSIPHKQPPGLSFQNKDLIMRLPHLLKAFHGTHWHLNWFFLIQPCPPPAQALSIIIHVLYAQHYSKHLRVLISSILNPIRHVTIIILFMQMEIEAQTGSVTCGWKWDTY